MNHSAIRKAYPNVVTIDDTEGAFDIFGNRVEIDDALVESASIEVEKERKEKNLKLARALAYRDESDPIFFKSQRGEALQSEWIAKVEEIRARFPYAE